jgi:tetratricopeptide (TPR) repeat protein
MALQTPATALPMHVLERADMREAIARHDFGAVFALSRKWAGISYSRIAESCAIKPERVGALARGQGRITSYEKIALIADSLRLPGHMLGLAPRVWESVPSDRSQAGSESDSVLRRDFLKASTIAFGSAIAFTSFEWDKAGSPRGKDLVASLRARTARLRKLDDVLGGGDTYRLYASEYMKTNEMLRRGTFTESVRSGLISVLAEQAQQAGWAAFDAGDRQGAIRLYEASQSAAQEAGDKALAANALAFMAYERVGQDASASIELADASFETAGHLLVGSVGALLHERRAWVHAVAGNAAEAIRALDAAADALACSAEETEPNWSSWVTRDELSIMTGRCWAELGRPLRAVPVLQSALEQFDDGHARDKALYLSWLADSYLSAGEVEEAAQVVSRVLDLSADVASVRPRQQIAGVLDRLKDHRSVEEVAAALERAEVA